MIVFSILTIYSIVKKYVAVNNKENTANILLLNIFLYTKSDFIVFDFTMKSLPIIRSRKKRAISKMSINDIISVNV